MSETQIPNPSAKSPDPEAIKEDEAQYGSGPLSLAELYEQFPDRPRNHAPTLLFSELLQCLFDPLNDTKKHLPSGPPLGRFRGTSGAKFREHRELIIARFMARWRAEVGPDFYPALRLILPDKDGDRGVYGLKESTIAKLLVKAIKIDKNSTDGHNLLHWKLPARTAAGRMAGDFAGRCFEVLRKREMRAGQGQMRVGEVNVLLDRLARASGEAEQLPILETFYARMKAEEMMWLIRILLKEMRVGATEKTILRSWHPDAEALFNVSSSLRRVCWELWDPKVRLQGEDDGDGSATNVTIMQCFQPQLAQFQMNVANFGKMVEKLGVSSEKAVFWIEEKLDGERMQMHMQEDTSVAGGFRFSFWSRKAKDYTYLYGEGLEDENSALTRHLKEAFHPRVRNLILDGEMITWDPERDKIVAFGTLKTAALEQQKNPYNRGPRPVFRVFDMLLLNDKPLTRYALRARRGALEQVVKNVPQRLEIHPHVEATSADQIEPELRKVVADASEGLVLKNPESVYRLNSRNDDWIKVKPEYMHEFGESIDCLIIGGYFGSGRRGGRLSSFLCGVRVSERHVRAGAHHEKCFSFFRVGGGFKAEDYHDIRLQTEGKWTDWDSSKPPSKYIELGGGERLQHEKPDVWIRPRESVILSVKATQITESDQFSAGFTLRFPRFRALRLDRAWDSGLNTDELELLRSEERVHREEMTMEKRTHRRQTKRARRELVIAGTHPSAARVDDADNTSTKSALFEGLTFCVLSGAQRPPRMAKPALEGVIKEHGGLITQRAGRGRGGDLIILADKMVVAAASLIRGRVAKGRRRRGKSEEEEGQVDMIRPSWIFDCVAQGWLLPYEEERHVFHAETEGLKAAVRGNVDRFGDSFARDVEAEEMGVILKRMPKTKDLTGCAGEHDGAEVMERLEAKGVLEGLRGFLFRRCVVCLVLAEAGCEVVEVSLTWWIRFGGGKVVSAGRTGYEGLESEEGKKATHVVIVAGENEARAREAATSVRCKAAGRRKGARIVTGRWVEDCWRERTLIDEQEYAPR